VVEGSVRCVELCTSRQSVYHRCELGTILPDAVRWGRAASSYGVLSRGMSCVRVECTGSMSIFNINVVATTHSTSTHDIPPKTNHAIGRRGPASPHHLRQYRAQLTSVIYGLA
jgi:hypothetical protein